MNQLSATKKFLFLVKYIILPAFFIKFFCSILLFYLDKDLIFPKKYSTIRFNSYTKLAYKILDFDKSQERKEISVGRQITDFTLKGTYVDGENSFVIIEDGLKTEFIYMYEKYEGYELVNVYDDKAIFEKDNEAYQLRLYDKSIDDYTIDETKNINKKVADNYTVPMNIKRSEIEYFTDNPDEIWNKIRIIDYRTEEGLNFKISYVKRGSLFANIGLKAGDIITAINGEVPQSLADVMKYYVNISSMDSLILTIKRGNQEMDIDFQIKE